MDLKFFEMVVPLLNVVCELINFQIQPVLTPIMTSGSRVKIESTAYTLECIKLNSGLYG